MKNSEKKIKQRMIEHFEKQTSRVLKSSKFEVSESDNDGYDEERLSCVDDTGGLILIKVYKEDSDL